MNIQDHIRIIPDFPKPGIQFYDIATLLAHPEAFQSAIHQLKDIAVRHNPDLLMGIESRGFIVGTPLAMTMGCGFAMIRKKGKLPGKTASISYGLEYGEDSIEIQPDLIRPGSRVFLIDDLLATGGTMKAASDLIRKAGADIIGGACIIELDGLNGRDKLDFPFEALLNCPA